MNNWPMNLLGLLAIYAGFGFTNVSAKTYYVSPAGNDADSGTSQAKPWQTIDKINNTTFNGHDSLLLQGGASFTGCLKFAGSNVHSTTASRFVVSSYGTGKFTLTSNCTGYNAAVNIDGVSGIILQDAIIRAGTTKPEAGVWVQNSAGGAIVDSIIVQRCDVGGFSNNEIFISGYPGNQSGALNHVLILGNELHGLNGPNSTDAAGINGYGYTKNILDVVYQGNHVYNIGGTGGDGNGILCNGVDGGLGLDVVGGASVSVSVAEKVGVMPTWIEVDAGVAVAVVMTVAGVGTGPGDQ
jgi:hypothetical protein